MRKPDFFIVGAPKCGTTAMNNYLAQHPQIFMARKEMHCFGSDLQWRKPYFDCAGYLAQFAAAEPGQKAGEASVWYLYSREAAREIHRFQPQAKIIVMLRNPIDMLPSLHAQLVKTGDEDVLDFREALALEPERRLGKRLPQTDAPGIMESVLYREVASFSNQLERYFNVFGRERVHVILFDDFRRNVEAAYQSVLEFLEVDPSFRPPGGFRAVNTRKAPRLTGVWRAIRFAPLPVKRLWRAALPHAWRGQILMLTGRIFIKDAPPQPLPPAVREELKVTFRPEVERLGTLLERDLSHWLDA